MKAVRMYKPGDLRVEDVAVPSPGEKEVLLKVMACGVCGSDIPRVNKYGAHIAPLTVGHEFSAEVVELGKSTGDWKVGDRVTVPPLIPCYQCEWCDKGIYSLCENYDYFGSRRDGAMAEYVVSPIANLMKLPENVGYLDAATTDPCANALHGIKQSGLKEGESLVVFGAGPIGLYAIQCAKAFGASPVIAVDISDEKMEVAKKCGADYIINSKNEDAAKKIHEITGGGADVVIDFTGAPPAQLASIDSAGKMGRVVLLGISHQGLNLSEKHVDKMMRGQLSLIGSWNSFTKPFPGDDWFIALDLFAKKKISSEHMISHKLPLDKAPEMFRQIDKGGIFFNKILFLPFGEIF